MTSVLKKSRGTKGKSESMQEDLPTRWGNVSRGQKTEDAAKLIKFIDDNVIGKGNSFCGPYGRRKVVYCDYSGSGRALQWLEELVARDILPTHATRCTAMSYTSGQSEIYRAETHEIIRSSVGACPEDVVILGGSLPRVLRALRPQRVALFVSSRETERQIRPWRECGAEGYEDDYGNPNYESYSYVTPGSSYHSVPVSHLRRKVTRLPSKIGRAKKSYKNHIIAVNECSYKEHGMFDTFIDTCRNYISSNEPPMNHPHEPPMSHSHPHPMSHSHPHPRSWPYEYHRSYSDGPPRSYLNGPPRSYSDGPPRSYSDEPPWSCPPEFSKGHTEKCNHEANLNQQCPYGEMHKINKNQGPSNYLREPEKVQKKHTVKYGVKTKEIKKKIKDKILKKKQTKTNQEEGPLNKIWKSFMPCDCKKCNKEQQRKKRKKCQEKSAFTYLWDKMMPWEDDEKNFKKEKINENKRKREEYEKVQKSEEKRRLKEYEKKQKSEEKKRRKDEKKQKSEEKRRGKDEKKKKSEEKKRGKDEKKQKSEEKRRGKDEKKQKSEEKRRLKEDEKEQKRKKKEKKKKQEEMPCIGNVLKYVWDANEKKTGKRPCDKRSRDKRPRKKRPCECCQDMEFLCGVSREIFIIKIPESKEGFIDLNNLELRLQENSGTGKRMIGFFPAASKLTGVLADDVATTLLLHQYGAWSFWDYTLVAPTSLVDMNPTFPGVEGEMVKKDALFFNCEKFVGGVQGPFVAVVKKDVFKNAPVYADNIEVLSETIEEWQTTEAVRAAMAMQLREAVGLQQIAERQDNITRQVLSHIKNIPELILLGNESSTVRRLPIFSLMVKHPRGTFLHHNFVCAVLNDVFGIQARGGLNSNLNYGSDVLGIDDKLLKEYEKLLDVEAQKEVARLRKMSDAKSPDVPIHNEHLRPGFCRISLPFFMSDAELAFVLEALKMVATEGWKIMPQYVVNPQTGQWRHHTCSVLRDKKSLFAIRFNDGRVTSHERRVSGPGIFPQTYTECLQTARNLFNRARKLAMKCPIAEPEVAFHPKIDYLRWFMLPKEAHDLLLGRSGNVKHIVPFDPSGFTGARKSLHSRSCVTSSPILGASGRHFSLSAIDDCDIYNVKDKQKYYSRESSLKEQPQKETDTTPHPVKFAVGESVSPLRLLPHLSAQPSRLRCYSLGSDMPQAQLSAQAKLNLGLKETSPNKVIEKISSASSFCNCGSQTDLLSLDDPMISPGRAFPFSTPSSTSISDCSQVGRNSPTASLNSQTSEEHIHAYVKEMTKEIATEIKSEIREVISQVDDILENSDSLEQANISMNSTTSQNERNSVSVIDVAEYLMGMSREMASEVKHEIREMVNQVDDMISPEGTCSRKSSPPKTGRQRIGSGPELGLDLKRSQNTAVLKKCPTSPVLPTQYADDEDRFCKRSPSLSPKSAQCTPSHDSSGPSSISFNSSETSTPDTIIQLVTTQNSPTLPKSLSSNKLSDEETICNDVNCRHCCIKKNWCQNPSISSQDSGINLSFTENDSYQDFVKWRTSSDPTTNKGKKLQGRLRMCQRHEKIEVPDIIEGVPVCSEDYTRLAKRYSEAAGEPGRVVFQIPDDADRQNRGVRSLGECKRLSRSSNASSSSSEHSSRSSGYGTDVSRPSLEDHYFDRSEAEYRLFKERWEDEQDDSSACSDTSLTDYMCDDDSKWHSLPKAVWKATVEAIHEYNMIRPGDKVLVCLSGGCESIALLHAMHQYQFYARAKGVHFSIGALFVHDRDSDVDPLHLMAYCRTLGVKLIYQDNLEDENPQGRHSSRKLSELQRWATHAVRRRAYTAAAAHGYGVAAVAQHLDHAARVFLANAFHGGALTSIKAHYRVREHCVRIIRPFVYVRARSLAEFCMQRALPEFRAPRSPTHSDDSTDTGKEVLLERSVSEPCSPAEKRAARARRGEGACGVDAGCEGGPLAAAAALLMEQETEHPFLFSSLKNALHPLISARNIEKDLKESRHRKKSVIQMKDGAPVYDSEEGTEEEPVP